MALTNAERQTLKDAVEIINRETDNDGDKLIVKGFGTFSRKLKAARTARNPQTGDTIDIPARSVLAFKASKQGTERVL
jgi:nucleoid DNA-binding protein